MSTRVLPVGGFINFNYRMSELRRRLQPPVPVTQPEVSQSEEQQPVQSRSVRRNLFGPIDHDENLKFVQEELTKISSADLRRWNFDFKTETPLEGRFTWETAKEGQVPVAYDMPNLTCRLTQPDPSPSTSKVTIESSMPPSSKAQSTTPTPVPSSETTCPSKLEQTLTSVTTACTTIMTTTLKNTSEDTADPPSPVTFVSSSSDQPLHKSQLLKIPVKQPPITDFLKIRKRAHPSSSTEAKVESEEDTSVLKRARTST